MEHTHGRHRHEGRQAKKDAQAPKKNTSEIKISLVHAGLTSGKFFLNVQIGNQLCTCGADTTTSQPPGFNTAAIYPEWVLIYHVPGRSGADP